MHKFYVKMDGDTFGPYTAKQIQELQLMDDILVTEESMNEWLPAGRFDFNDMAKKELNELLSQRRTQNNDEENVRANNPLIAQYSGSSQKTSSKPRKIGKTILYGFISIIAVAILGGLLYYKQTQNNEAKLEQNKLIAFAKYNHIGDFGEHGASGLALVEMEVDGDDFYGMINGRYEEVVPCIYQEINQFEYGVSVARLNGKYAVINTEGSIKKHLNYTNVLDFSDDGFAKAYIDDLECYINRQGEEQCPLYDYIGYWDEDDYGMARVSRDGKDGYMNKDFEEVVECKYDDIRGFCDGLARVELNGLYGYVDNTGEVIIPIEYDDTDYDFYKGIERVAKNGKWGVIDKSNNILVPLKYSKLSGFGEDSYKGMPNGIALAERNGYEVLVNMEGKEVSKLYDEIRGFYDKNYAIVVNRDGDIAFGCIDRTGKEIVPCIYSTQRAAENEL